MIGDRSTAFAANERAIKSMFTMQNCTNRGDIIAKTGVVNVTYKKSTTEPVTYTETKSYSSVRVGGLIGMLTMSPLEKSMFVHSNNSGKIVIDDYTPDQNVSGKVSVSAGGLVGSVLFLTMDDKSTGQAGQLTLACGNNGNVIIKSSSDKITLNNNSEKWTGEGSDDFKISLGTVQIYYSQVTAETYKRVLNIVYIVNTGEQKTDIAEA